MLWCSVEIQYQAGVLASSGVSRSVHVPDFEKVEFGDQHREGWVMGDFVCGFWQPGPDAIGIIAISHGCAGIAARACGLVGLEPTKV